MLFYDGEELVRAEETESGSTLRNESLLYNWLLQEVWWG
jgi:hypothetical protein